MNTKRCIACGNEFPATPDYFTRRKASSDGLHSRCIKCKREYDSAIHSTPEQKAKRKTYLSGAYKERANQLQRERNARLSPDEKQKLTFYKREWFNRKMQDPEYRISVKTQQSEYHKRPEVLQRQSAAFRRAVKEGRYKEARQIKDHRRKAKKRQLPNNLTTTQWCNALNYFGNKCAVCGCEIGDGGRVLSADHWIPLSSPNCPGTVVENMIPLCHGVGGCNNSKSNKDAFQWLKNTFGIERAQIVMDRIISYFEWAKAHGTAKT